MRTRFAPSPTGELHLGNARTALLAWLHARSAGGRFVMRVEDLDQGRSRAEYVDGQLADLRWLGLDWDEGPDVGGPFGPYLQSRRRHLYEEALATLDARGFLFPCFCSRKEIAAAASAPQGADEEGPAYPGTCLRIRASAAPGGAPGAERGGAALRMRVAEGRVCFDDAVMGRRCYEPAVDTGAFVVRRRDGVAAYQLAVVVDDHAMAISHVLRGADLLSSTARQILLYQALEWEPPAWIHVPLLLGPDGERLAKRVGGVTLRELREAGVTPERVVGWLAHSCGLGTAGAESDPHSLVGEFDLGRIPTAPTIVESLPIGRSG